MSPSGVLVECDASIKAIILKIDQDKHDYIVEDLDDHTLVIKENQLSSLKARLEEVLIRCLLGIACY
jgi:TFIIH basal transcription factor complex TTD-A subunit